MVEDDKVDAMQFHEAVHGVNDSNFPRITVKVCDSIEEARRALTIGGIDLVVLDLNLPDTQDLEGLKILINNHPEIPIVVHSGTYSSILAAEAIAIGAQDFIIKGSMNKEDLMRTLVHAKIRHDTLWRLHSLAH